MDAETKRAQLKDNEGNSIMQIQHSKSPIEEFPDTAYRGRSSDFDPTRPFGDQSRQIPAHHMIQSMAFVIYELNKFPCASTIQNAKERENQIYITTSIGCNLRRAISIGHSF